MTANQATRKIATRKKKSLRSQIFMYLKYLAYCKKKGFVEFLDKALNQ